MCEEINWNKIAESEINKINKEHKRSKVVDKNVLIQSVERNKTEWVKRSAPLTRVLWSNRLRIRRKRQTLAKSNYLTRFNTFQPACVLVITVKSDTMQLFLDICIIYNLGDSNSHLWPVSLDRYLSLIYIDSITVTKYFKILVNLIELESCDRGQQINRFKINYKFYDTN